MVRLGRVELPSLSIYEHEGELELVRKPIFVKCGWVRVG